MDHSPSTLSFRLPIHQDPDPFPTAGELIPEKFLSAEPDHVMAASKASTETVAIVVKLSATA